MNISQPLLEKSIAESFVFCFKILEFIKTYILRPAAIPTIYPIDILASQLNDGINLHSIKIPRTKGIIYNKSNSKPAFTYDGNNLPNRLGQT